MERKKLFINCLWPAGVLLASSLCFAAPTMVERNLFAQDRKPPSPESATAPAQTNKPPMPVSNIQLDGIMIQGNTKKALLRLKSQGAGPDKKKGSPFITVRENQQVGDYRVVKIENKSISLEKDGQTFVISLFAENKVATPVTAQPQPNNPPPQATPEQQGGSPQAPPITGRARGQGPHMLPGQAGDPGAQDPGLVQQQLQQQDIAEQNVGAEEEEEQ